MIGLGPSLIHIGPLRGAGRSSVMLRKIAIALAAASLLGAASIPTDALAFGRGGGGGGHGGFGRGFGPGFRGHRFARFGVPFGLGLGLGYGAYSYYGDSCYAWTPYGYRWV